VRPADNPPAEDRFRVIFRKLHAQHPACLADEWLSEPCRLASGRTADRSIVWSRRNGPWQTGDILWVGAAPGNAGGKGGGPLGAHGTRIPFGGDIAGGNLDVLLSSIGLDRNHTFITASLNQLPARGGGEPTLAELNAPVGEYPNSLQVVRDTILAVQPRLLIALGNVALRVCFAALRLAGVTGRLPSLEQLQSIGLARNHALPWPAEMPTDDQFRAAWDEIAQTPLPHVLWLTHPSAQNMSPYARRETLFHTRMLEARDALQEAAREVLGYNISKHPRVTPSTGIYDLPEWRELIAPRHHELVRLWHEKGL
jgi:uracil-DNA glycosylase family 4